jgi:hypothetical protein
LCTRKGIVDSRTVLYWAAQTFLLGYPSLSLLIAYKRR